METESKQGVPNWSIWYISLGIFLLGLIAFFLIFSAIYQ